MKNHKKTITVLLTAAALLITVFVTGCTRLSEVLNNPISEADVPAESDGSGVYVKLEREDAEITWGSEPVCLWLPENAVRHCLGSSGRQICFA